MFLKTIIFVIGSLVLTNGLILECTYSIRTVWFEPYYTCLANIIFIGHERNVTEVSQNHLPGYNDRLVQSIDIVNQIVRLPPRNIEAFFPNLASYRLVNTQTEVVHPNDINKFPLLKYYLCQRNPQVTKIPPNMFAGNPNLAGIALNAGNRIQHIAYHAFDNLDKLVHLFIDGLCVNLAITNNRNDVEANLFNVFRSCPPDLEMLKQQLCQRSCWGIQ